MGSRDPALPGERLFQVARDWLAEERRATGPDQQARHEARARVLSAEYDALVANSTTAELDVAWHVALEEQRATQPGGAEWLELDSLVSLLRTEWRARAEP